MAKGRRKRASSGKTRKFNGKRYTKKSCHSTKTAAKSTRKRLNAKGKKARVVKVGSKYCVYAA